MPTREVTLKPSTIETIDFAIYNLINDGFDLHTSTNTGFKKVPVLWISPERSFNSDIRHIYILRQLGLEDTKNTKDLYLEKLLKNQQENSHQ